MSIHPTSQKLMETIAEWEHLSAASTESIQGVGLPPKQLIEDTVALLRGYLYMAGALKQFKITMGIFFRHYDNIFGDEDG